MKVLIEKFNGQKIDFIDPFENRYMDSIILSLKDLKKMIHRAYKDKNRLDRLLKRIFSDGEQFSYNSEEELINVALKKRAQQEFHHYFHSKCEYETILKMIDGQIHVCGWPCEETHRELTDEEQIELLWIIQENKSLIASECGLKIDWWTQVEFRWDEVLELIMQYVSKRGYKGLE